MQTFKTLIAMIILLAIALAAFAWSGLYNIGADSRHWWITTSLLTIVRDRSIVVHARSIDSPNLDDPKLVAMGAEHYSEMCTGCHLAPGSQSSELREGLYPKPPVLYKIGIQDPAKAFWVIKHGIKMTGMPAWGASHSDQAIWAMVAFLKKLPELSPEQYKAITVNANSADGSIATPPVPTAHSLMTHQHPGRLSTTQPLMHPGA